MKSESQKVVIRKGGPGDTDLHQKARGTIRSLSESLQSHSTNSWHSLKTNHASFEMSECLATAVLLIKQIMQVTVIQTHCNWNSDAATAQTFLLVLISTWHDRVTWCCKVAVTETKPLRTSYLSYRHRNLCWPIHGSAIVAAAGVCLTAFTSHKSALYSNECLTVSCDLDSQGLTATKAKFKRARKTYLINGSPVHFWKGSSQMRWGRSTGVAFMWDI